MRLGGLVCLVPLLPTQNGGLITAALCGIPSALPDASAALCGPKSFPVSFCAVMRFLRVLPTLSLCVLSVAFILHFFKMERLLCYTMGVTEVRSHSF